MPELGLLDRDDLAAVALHAAVLAHHPADMAFRGPVTLRRTTTTRRTERCTSRRNDALGPDVSLGKIPLLLFEKASPTQKLFGLELADDLPGCVPGGSAHVRRGTEVDVLGSVPPVPVAGAQSCSFPACHGEKVQHTDPSKRAAGGARKGMHDSDLSLQNISGEDGQKKRPVRGALTGI
jgi:hypothetical protein